MVTQEDLPHPDNCLWCLEARNCTKVAFLSKEILDPILQPNQTIQEYLSTVCDCGHQLIPSWAEGSDIPKYLPHTKLCKEHTLRWMMKVIDLKLKYESQ